MKTFQMPLPLLAGVAVTRGLLGLGIGLLVARSMPERVRRRVGWSLVALGALSTIPLAARVFGQGAEQPFDDQRGLSDID